MSTNANSSAANSSDTSCPWTLIEGFLHATIDGGTMLRIDDNWPNGKCIDNILQLLTDGGWKNLHRIPIRMGASYGTASEVDRQGAIADLKAYATFLYQGRLKKPIAAAELGHPEAGLRHFPHGIRSYATDTMTPTKS